MNSADTPRLTIAIPTLRRFELLREAVNSARRQERCEFEVLLSQDRLPDGTLGTDIAEWCGQVTAADARIRYLAAPRRLGLAGNWNLAAERARGEFITIIGDDDRLLPEFGATLLAHADTADVVFANHHVIDASGARLPEATASSTQRFFRHELVPGEQRPAAACVWRNAVPMSGCIVRTSIARRHRFAEHLNTPDIEFFARLAAEGARFYFCPEYLAEYRVHPQSATAGGLTMADLVAALEPVAVPPELEPLKRSLIGEFADAALRDGLLSRDGAALRRACASRHARSPLARALKSVANVPVLGLVVLASASWAYRAARQF
jgi:glycosyltransferase involved in cell wall biosynthesis